MEDIVIKTLLCAEEPITSSAFNMPNRYNCYELFGFDIILDTKLKPWLLEVNISPSLHSSSPLDLAVKAPLIREVFNIVGYHLTPCMPPAAKVSYTTHKYWFKAQYTTGYRFNLLGIWIDHFQHVTYNVLMLYLQDKIHKLVDSFLKLETPVFDKRLYATILSKEEKAKHSSIKAKFDCREKVTDTAFLYFVILFQVPVQIIFFTLIFAVLRWNPGNSNTWWHSYTNYRRGRIKSMWRIFTNLPNRKLTSVLPVLWGTTVLQLFARCLGN